MARAPNALQSALRLCESDKVKDRSEGISAIRTFFSNKENLAVFQETARRDGGGGWVAFFQCLFQLVSLEKRATLRKTANAQSEYLSSVTEQCPIPPQLSRCRGRSPCSPSRDRP
jgi:hypothetical protein